MGEQLPPSGEPGFRAVRGHPEDRGRRARSGWNTFGCVVAVVLALSGLAVIGAVVLLSVGMSNYGSNK